MFQEEKKQVVDLISAIENGDEDTALQMLRQDFDDAASFAAASSPAATAAYKYLACARYRYGSTPLHWAASYGRLRVIRELLSMKNNSGAAEMKSIVDVNAQNEWGRTPLHNAVYWSQREAAQMLIDAGADVFIKDNAVSANGAQQEIEGLLLVEQKMPTSTDNQKQTNAQGKSPMDCVDCRGIGAAMQEMWLRRQVQLQLQQQQQQQQHDKGESKLRVYPAAEIGKREYRLRDELERQDQAAEEREHTAREEMEQRVQVTAEKLSIAKQQIEQASKREESLKNRCADLEARNSQLESDVAALQLRTSEEQKDLTLQVLHSQLEHKDEHIATLRQVLAQVKQQLSQSLQLVSGTSASDASSIAIAFALTASGSSRKFLQWSMHQVAEWVNSLGEICSKWSSVFVDNGIDGAVLGSLQEKDLADMGITMLGARRKIIATRDSMIL